MVHTILNYFLPSTTKITISPIHQNKWLFITIELATCTRETTREHRKKGGKKKKEKKNNF